MRNTYDYSGRYEILIGCGMNHSDAIYRIADERNESDIRVRSIIDNYLAGMFFFLLIAR